MTAIFRQKHSSLIAAVAFQEDTVITGSYDKTFKIWEASTGITQYTSEQGPDAVCCVALHVGTSSAFTTSRQAVTQWCLDTFTAKVQTDRQQFGTHQAVTVCTVDATSGYVWL